MVPLTAMANGLLSRLLERVNRPATSQTELLEQAIERAVMRVEPRLRQLRDYPARYRKPIARALEHAQRLAEDIPGPIEMSLEQFGRDPFVHALFSSPEEMQRALYMSHAMHEYARRPGGPGNDAYALMGMRRREKTTFGMELQGEILRREVAQQVVYFTDHTLTGLAPTEAEARQQLVWSLFDSLIQRVIDRVNERLCTKANLLRQKDYLVAKLRNADAISRPILQQQLDALLAKVITATQATDLRHLADDFDAILLNPESYLRLERVTLRLDPMGILRTDGSETNTHSIDFTDLYGRDRRRWTVVMVHCHPQPELLSVADRLREAGRWLQL